MGKKKSTEELENILNSTHMENAASFLADNSESLIEGDRAFSEYFKKLLKEKKMKQQDVFLCADIPERYGYKLLSEEKRTRQRDVILRLCYAAKFSLEETQEALKLYRFPELYAKIPRDAFIMIAFNQRKDGIAEINHFLAENGMAQLYEVGEQDI